MEMTARSGSPTASAADEDGNVWAAMGWVGDGYDGVHVFAPDGTRIGQIRLPEIIGNLCFGGTKRNRLFMAGSTSLYAVYVETRGGHPDVRPRREARGASNGRGFPRPLVSVCRG